MAPGSNYQLNETHVYCTLGGHTYEQTNYHLFVSSEKGVVGMELHTGDKMLHQHHHLTGNTCCLSTHKH